MRLLIPTLIFFAVVASFSAVYESKAATTDERRVVVCTARNLTGKRFTAIGLNNTLVQERAMRMCEAESFRCYPTGCREE